LKIKQYEYKIDENNAVRIWDSENPNENNAPFFYQPDHPDGVAWTSKDAAEQWVKEFINDLLQPAPVKEEIL
jgi:hypothetical protein